MSAHRWQRKLPGELTRDLLLATKDYLFFVAALLTGLGLASHIASLIFLLPAVVLVLWPGRNARVTPRALILASLFFLVPLVF